MKYFSLAPSGKTLIKSYHSFCRAVNHRKILIVIFEEELEE